MAITIRQMKALLKFAGGKKDPAPTKFVWINPVSGFLYVTNSRALVRAWGKGLQVAKAGSLMPVLASDLAEQLEKFESEAAPVRGRKAWEDQYLFELNGIAQNENATFLRFEDFSLPVWDDVEAKTIEKIIPDANYIEGELPQAMFSAENMKLIEGLQETLNPNWLHFGRDRRGKGKGALIGMTLDQSFAVMVMPFRPHLW